MSFTIAWWIVLALVARALILGVRLASKMTT
jgi:hypothetical protein